MVNLQNESGRRSVLLFTSLVGSVTLGVTSSDAAFAGGQRAEEIRLNRAELRAERRMRRDADSLSMRLPERVPIRHQIAGTLPLANLSSTNTEFSRRGQRLDLSSMRNSVTLNDQLFENSESLSIDVGGTTKSFTSGSRVTAAEYVALTQVGSGAAQTIRLDVNGAAVDGSFSLDAVASKNVSRLVIPEGITGIDNVGSDKSLGISGNLINFGAIQVVSAGGNNSVISARHIANRAGATISTELPGAASNASTAAIDLTLQAERGIVNRGVISSSGSLTLTTASGAIENSTETNKANSVGTLTSRGDLNLVSGDGHIINNGSIVSSNGDINMSSSANDVDINVFGANGTFNAINGDIKIRDVSYQGLNNINLVGGNYLSNNLNLFSGTGTITAMVGDVTGKLNTVAGVDHIYAQTATLYLSNNCVSGDPTFVNLGGDIVIDGDNIFNEDVAILATGNILANATGNIINPGHDVSMVAGAGLTLSVAGNGGNNNASQNLSGATKLGGGRTVTVDFSTGTGGDIDLTASTFFNIIDTTGFSASVETAGGNVTLAARANGATGGHVLLNPISNISTIGTGNNAGGNVVIVAGAAPVAQEVVIQVGDIFTGAGSFLSSPPPSGDSGSITLSTSAPTNSSGGNTVVFNELGKIIAGGGIAGLGPIGNLAQVVAGNLSATAPGMGNGVFSGYAGANSSPVFVLAGHNITTENVLAYGQGGLGGFFDFTTGAGAGGAGGAGAPITLSSINGSITVNGSVNSSGGGGGGGAGGSEDGSGPATGGAGGLGGAAGDILISAAGGVQVTGGIFAADGGAGGSGGSGVGGDGGAGGGGGSLGGGGGGGGDDLGNGGGGGSGIFGGGGGEFIGGGGGGTPIGPLQGGGFPGDLNAGDGSAGVGGDGAGGAAGGTLFNGGQGASGTGSGANGSTGSSVNLTSGGGDVTVIGDSLDLESRIVGEDVSIETPVASGSGYTIQDAITGTNSITLKADGAGSITRVGALSVLTAPTVNLSSGSGNLGANTANAILTAAQNLTANTSGSVFISNVGAVTVGASSAGNAQTFELLNSADANGNGKITIAGDIAATVGTINQITFRSAENSGGTGGIARTSGTLTAVIINLSDNVGGSGNGNIGDVGAPLLTATSNLEVNTTGDVNITNVGAVNLLASSGNNFTLTNNNTISTNGDTTAAGILTLNTPGLTVAGGDTLTGASVAINGPLGSDLTITNAGDITALSGSLTILSTPNAGVGGDVLIGGGGNLNAVSGAISITAVTEGALNNVIEFTGDQTFNGNTTLNAFGNNQSVIVDNGATVVGNNTVVLNSPLLSLIGTGTLSGNPLIINSSGTIANSTGPIDLSTFGSLTFNGRSLAILSAGDITDSGADVTIDLSNASGDGGSLTLIAGFNFTPSTGGATVGPDFTLYTITGASTGSIDLGNTTVNTTGSDSGGNLFAYATGSVTLGSADTSADNVASGSIDIKGSGVTINETLVTQKLFSIANAGDVSIFSGTVSTSGLVQVSGGITSGSFTNGTAGGDINFQTISTRTGDVNLTTGASGAIRGDFVSAAALVGNSGSAGIGEADTPLAVVATDLTFNAGSAGNVFVETALDSNLVGSNSGAHFEVNASQGLNITSPIVANEIVLFVIESLNFASNTVAAVTDAGGNGGIIDIEAKSITWDTSATQPLNFVTDGSVSGHGGSIAVRTENALALGVAAGQTSFSARSGAAGGDGGAVSVITDSAVMIDTGAIQIAPLGVNGTGGSIQIDANVISSSSVTALVLDASGVGTGDGGEIFLFDSSSTAHDIGTGAGDFTLLAQSGLNGGNGGSVSFLTKGALTVDLAGVKVNPRGTNGNGGSINLRGSTVSNAVAGNLVVDASGVGTGDGGFVEVNTLSNLNVGLGTSEISLVARSGLTGGDGGEARAVSSGILSVDTQAIDVDPRGTNGAGGTIFLFADAITWPTVATEPLGLDASGIGTGDGGSVIVSTVGTTPVSIGQAAGEIQLSAQSGLTGGDGGTASVNVFAAVLNIDANAISVSPRGTNGNGGSIRLRGNTLLFPGALALSANGIGSGDGGLISLSQTNSSIDLTVGDGVGQLLLSTTSGETGGDGGEIAVFSAGALTVDPAALSFHPLAKEGNGGSLTLSAGGGNLLITDNLNADGRGKTGVGGAITLLSNSTSTFDIGSTDTGNGIVGGISVKGKPGGGDIFVENADGDVTNSAKLAKFSNLVLRFSGDIIVHGKLGDKAATSISFFSFGLLGGVTSDTKSASATAQSISFNASGVGTATSAFAISTNQLSVSSDVLVNLTNKSKGVLTVEGNVSGDAFKLSSNAAISVLDILAADTTLTLTATGRAGIQTSSSGLLSAPSIILNSGKDGIGTATQSLLFSGDFAGGARSLIADSKGAVNVQSVGTGQLNLAGSNTGKSFSLNSEGDVVVAGSIATTKATVLIDGDGDILQGGGQINGKVVTLQAQSGGIGTLIAPLAVNTAALSTMAQNAVFVDNLNTKTTTINDSVGSSLSFTTAGATTINDLTATNGSISVINATGLLQTSAGASLQANSVGAGSILLQNNNTTKGSIVIGEGSTISTLTASDGDIDISIGAPQAGVVGPTPANVTVVALGISGNVFFSANGITASSPNNTLNYKNANIIFTNPLSAKAILLDGGVTMTADPPASSVELSSIGTAESTITSMMPLSSAGVLTSSTLPNGDAPDQQRAFTYSPLGVQPSIDRSVMFSGESIENRLPGPIQLDTYSLSNYSNMQDVLSSIKFAPTKQATAWISETELASGMIPATMAGDEWFETEADGFGASDLSVVENGSTRKMSLKKGSVLLAPVVNSSTETPFGKIDVDAGALVLIMPFENGVAVFNVDDTHKNAVRVTVGGKQIALAPGSQACVTNRSVKRFEEINPAQLFGYGQLNEVQLDRELKAFTSEFSVVQAVKTVLPLKKLVVSQNPKAKKLVRHLLKTSAILHTLKGSQTEYRQFYRPATVACGLR